MSKSNQEQNKTELKAIARALASATTSIRGRGKNIFREGVVDLKNRKGQNFTYAVEASSRDDFYSTTINIAGDKALFECNCPYGASPGDPCKHVVAALLDAEQTLLFEEEDSKEQAPETKKSKQQKAQNSKQSSEKKANKKEKASLDEAGYSFHNYLEIDTATLEKECTVANLRMAQNSITAQDTPFRFGYRGAYPDMEAEGTEFLPGQIVFTLAVGFDRSHKRVDIKVEETGLRLKSDLKFSARNPLDKYKTFALMYLAHYGGRSFFADYNRRFSEILNQYGFNPENKAQWEAYFQPVLTPEGLGFESKVKMLRPLSEVNQNPFFAGQRFLPQNKEPATKKTKKVVKDIPVLLLYALGQPLLEFGLGLTAHNKNGTLKKPDVLDQDSKLLARLPQSHYALIPLVFELSDMLGQLNQQEDLAEAMDAIRRKLWRLAMAAKELEVPILAETMSSAETHASHYGKSYEKQVVAFAKSSLGNRVAIEEDKVFYRLDRRVMVEGKALHEQARNVCAVALLHNSQIYIGESLEDTNAALQHALDAAWPPEAMYADKQGGFQAFFNEYPAYFSPWSKLEVPEGVNTVELNLEPVRTRVYLRQKESGEVSFFPLFLYQREEEELELPPNESSEAIFEAIDANTVLMQKRDKFWEEEQMALLRALHPTFAMGNQFSLSPEQMLEENWFLDFNDKLKNAGMELLGQKDLKSFKVNMNKPLASVRVSSGMDWLDLRTDIQFGDQKVDLKQIREALLKNRKYVTLKDGTLGMLPEEWLKKYEGLFRVGKLDKNGLKVSNMHMGLMDEVLDDIEDKKVREELQAKKERLRNFSSIAPIAKPESVKATLRDYQQEGLNWLGFLEEFGWGGLLADDMGLGKTLQVLAFLTHRLEQKPEGVHLAVLPASLIFNWQDEVQKFVPHFKVYAHHGTERKKSLDGLKANLVLTTYHTLRNDLDLFKTQEWDYIVLDEAQAVKNPAAQVSKAVKQLPAKNRLAMTGTPVENSTFDLFSIFDFLNPGFFGGMDTFRREYAKPIDQDKDVERAGELHKLVNPFLLRRTKKQVATELPDKTETTLWVEMGNTQRKEYERLKKKFRQEAVDAMMEGDKFKMGRMVMQGLMKLRQVCSMPSLLTGNNSRAMKDSVKLSSLVEELEEVVPNHKVLVFGQFLDTLRVLGTELDKRKIPYLYLDGSTKDRKELVGMFQEDEKHRVFLISLKAGGTGLNLTKAEYVFLLEPWWNPAVEQQAIDRAYRIGQANKVFAYRMACRNSIEEKILKLQANKHFTAEQLIQTEESLMKSLSKEELVSLFD